MPPWSECSTSSACPCLAPAPLFAPRTAPSDILVPMPGYGARYWEERTADNRRRTYPKFKGSETADAVIIGGGLTGATAAFVLASGGLKVVVLEAGRLAGGATAGDSGPFCRSPTRCSATSKRRPAVAPRASRGKKRTAARVSLPPPSRNSLPRAISSRPRWSSMRAQLMTARSPGKNRRRDARRRLSRRG